MEAITGTIELKRGREKPVLNGHPWVFSGAVARVTGAPAPGDLVAVTANERYLATAYYNPHSQIRARILTHDRNQSIDDAFWQARLARALQGREALRLLPETNAYRLVNAEADALPGLVVDRYDTRLVLQSLTLGIDRRKALIAALLRELLPLDGLLERSDLPVRAQEGLDESSGVIWGTVPERTLIRENGLPFEVDLYQGHKTGFYLDQRMNRAALGHPRHVADKRVLNVFAYTGGFAVYAAAAGAGPITNIDSSKAVLELAESNVARVAPDRPEDEYIAGDAFEVLRHYRDNGRAFDLIILDPPKFASRRRDLNRATRGYKDLNWLALRLLAPGGLLATFSCSGLVSADLFQKVLFGAALDAGRDVQILQHLSQAPDHPVALRAPESAYLKGFLCRVW